jgi:hypothetical protein
VVEFQCQRVAFEQAVVDLDEVGDDEGEDRQAEDGLERDEELWGAGR